jgi:hypothetical protein
MIEGRYMRGSAEVRYSITNTRQVVMLSAKGSPDTIAKLTQAVMSLEGDPVLDFPAGTQCTEHPRMTAVQSGWQQQKIRQYWGNEHVIKQW